MRIFVNPTSSYLEELNLSECEKVGFEIEYIAKTVLLLKIFFSTTNEWDLVYPVSHPRFKTK